MSALLLSLLWKLWPIAVGVAAWLFAKGFYERKGAAKEKAKQAAADKRANDIADDVQNDVRAMSPEQVDAELRKRAKK